MTFDFQQMSQSSINHDRDEEFHPLGGITDDELESALETAETSFAHWRGRTPGERARVISEAAAILRSRLDEFATPMAMEMNHLLSDARREVALTAEVMDYFAKNSESLLHPDVDPAFSESAHFGIVFGVQPDSFPYFQLARLAAPNLMAGNVVIVKHVEKIPPCALAFEKLWLEAGAPVGTYTNLLVSSVQSIRLLEDPRIKCASTGGMDAVNRIARSAGSGGHPSFGADHDHQSGCKSLALCGGFRAG